MPSRIQSDPYIQQVRKDVAKLCCMLRKENPKLARLMLSIQKNDQLLELLKEGFA